MAHLCPTNSVGGESIYHVNTISSELEQIVFRVSNHMPVCIVSSKDFEFLHNRVRFAWIISCVLGLETIGIILTIILCRIVTWTV
jgi:hypothetical protein